MSLADQLLKAGLVDKKKVNKAKQQRNKQEKQQRKSRQVVVDEVKLSAQQAREEKASQDRLLNQQRKEESDKKALQAQIKQLIEMNRQPKSNDGTEYKFAYESVVKRVVVASDIHKAIVDGRLAIVSFDGTQFEVVPTVVAEKIAQRDATKVVLVNEHVETAEDADDPYADYQIPDDLMW